MTPPEYSTEHIFSLTVKQPSPFVVYVDESGDHGLNNIDAQSPIFVVCAALYKITEYVANDLPSLSRIKFGFWGHDNVIFRSFDIRKRLGPFKILTDKVTSVLFRATLADFFESKSRACLIAAAIDKRGLSRSYSIPDNPYRLALRFILERVHMHTEYQCRGCAPTVFVFESRGKVEDAELKGWFDRICAGDNFRSQTFNFEAVFADKKTNTQGLQIADLAAYPIAHFVRDQTSERPDWIAVRFRVRKFGFRMIGYGLKIFP